MTLVDDPRGRELAAAIARNPRDVDAYYVYADHLLERGDPRGELIATQLAAERAPERERAEARRVALAVFARHREHFLGPLGDLVRADAFDWARGFIHHACLAGSRVAIVEGKPIATSLAEVARAILAHPSARFLIKLTIGWRDPPPPPPDPWVRQRIIPPLDPRLVSAAGVAEVIAELAPPTLRELVVIDAPAFRFARAAPGLAHLTDLEVDGAFAATALELPALRALTLRAPIGGSHLRELARSPLPALASLTLDYTDDGGGEVADLDPLLRRDDLPHLTHLALARCPYANDVLARLVGTPVLARLAELQLTDSRLGDRGARQVARDVRAFRHLELFDVTGNQLSSAGARTLRAIAPDVIV